MSGNQLSNGQVILIQLVAIVLWGTVGTALGVIGVFASSHIPVIVLGWLFGGVGACIHILLIAYNISAEFWKIGCIIAVVAGALTFVWAPFAITQFAIPLYLFFGCLVYLGVNLVIALYCSWVQ